MIEEFKKIIESSDNIVFFGGAGVSTESGIPDFRSVDGLYNQKYDYPPETILSHTFFMEHTEGFYKFYRDKMIIHGVEPNITHKKLAELEEKGKVRAVVTQNIDGLHQAAGSKRVHELHGSVMRNYCTKCHAFYDLDYIMDEKNCAEGSSVPVCKVCGASVKPDVVLYGEALNDVVIREAVSDISSADCLIIGGTSLVVYPAAGFINYFNGDNMILINKTATAYDGKANLVIYDSIGKILGD